MLKFLFLLILSVCISSANIKNADATYEISYGIFGVMGKANATIKTDKNNNYTIRVKAYATGFSKILSGNLVETYLSKGKFVNNRFQPYYFQKVTKQNDKIKTYQYKFDYNKKIINLTYTKKYKDYTQDDIERLLNPSNSSDDYVWRTKTTKSVVKYWANEDILSLFFNIKHYISNINQTGIKQIKAVGAGSKRHGQVDIIVPDKKQQQEIANLLGQTQNILIVKIYKDIFSSKNGELYLSLRPDGICNKSLLKDVLFFGDVIGKLK